MNEYNEFRHLVGAYLGINSLDEYDLKFYVLKDIENYINEFVNNTKNLKVDFKKEKELLEKEFDIRTKLQDALEILPKIGASVELSLIINQKLKEMK